MQEVYIGSGAAAVAARPREMAASGNALLVADHVDTFYGKSHILNEVGFTLHGNETIALLGRNGAGKSTLLKTLIGIAPAAGGSIKLADSELIGLSSAQILIRRAIAQHVPTRPKASLEHRHEAVTGRKLVK